MVIHFVVYGRICSYTTKIVLKEGYYSPACESGESQSMKQEKDVKMNTVEIKTPDQRTWCLRRN